MDQLTSNNLVAWLACLAFVVVLVNGVLKLVDRTRQKPHPSDVQRESADKFTAKTEYQQHADGNRREHENLFSKIGGVDRSVRAHIDAQVALIQKDRAEQLVILNRQQQRFMFALGKIAEKLKVEIEPTE